MKLQLLFAVGSAAMMGMAASISIAVPQSPVVTYGIIRDELGSPLTKDAAARLELVKRDAPNGTVYAACDVGDYGYAGMNYRLSLEIDSAGPVRERAVVKGTPMKIAATLAGEAVELSPVSEFATPKQGTRQRLDYTLGEDRDGDGLPDMWEEWVLLMAGLDADEEMIAMLSPDDDLDGDGMTNRAEFLAGTDPFNKTDLFAISDYKCVGTGEAARGAITFPSVMGRSYRILMSETLSNPVWSPVSSSKSADGELVYAIYPGTGRKMTIYVSGALGNVFFKVSAE